VDHYVSVQKYSETSLPRLAGLTKSLIESSRVTVFPVKVCVMSDRASVPEQVGVERTILRISPGDIAFCEPYLTTI